MIWVFEPFAVAVAGFASPLTFEHNMSQYVGHIRVAQCHPAKLTASARHQNINCSVPRCHQREYRAKVSQRQPARHRH